MSPRRRPRAADGSAGFTLIEMLVAVAIFGVLIAVSFTVVVQLTRSTTDAKTRAWSGTETLLVFQTIDRQVRWSNAINAAGVSATGKSYVEFRIPKESNDNVTARCVQWRYDPVADVIQTRSWAETGSPGTVWTTKATGVQGTASTTYPFTMVPFSALGSDYQQLALSISAGGTQGTGNTDITTSYVARNSDSSPTNAGGSVCAPSGYRP